MGPGMGQRGRPLVPSRAVLPDGWCRAPGGWPPVSLCSCAGSTGWVCVNPTPRLAGWRGSPVGNLQKEKAVPQPHRSERGTLGWLGGPLQGPLQGKPGSQMQG